MRLRKFMLLCSERGADLGAGAAHVHAVLDAVRLLGERNRGGVVTQQRTSRYDCATPMHDVARVVALGDSQPGVRGAGSSPCRRQKMGSISWTEPVVHQEPFGDVGGDPGSREHRRRRSLRRRRRRRTRWPVRRRPPGGGHPRPRAVRAGGCRGSCLGALHHHLAVVQATDIGREQRGRASWVTSASR